MACGRLARRSDRRLIGWVRWHIVPPAMPGPDLANPELPAVGDLDRRHASPMMGAATYASNSQTDHHPNRYKAAPAAANTRKITRSTSIIEAPSPEADYARPLYREEGRARARVNRQRAYSPARRRRRATSSGSRTPQPAASSSPRRPQCPISPRRQKNAQSAIHSKRRQPRQCAWAHSMTRRPVSALPTVREIATWADIASYPGQIRVRSIPAARANRWIASTAASSSR